MHYLINVYGDSSIALFTIVAEKVEQVKLLQQDI